MLRIQQDANVRVSFQLQIGAVGYGDRHIKDRSTHDEHATTERNSPGKSRLTLIDQTIQQHKCDQSERRERIGSVNMQPPRIARQPV